ncbi:ribokinase-like [Scaptodrosophila lebanonensis]|uniref:Ribokinase n=1 Tax=Drosophila lebanonensis TaxID=7225 RepID=A0A6J2TUV3_DROLE|nr:ribokinase-like [Scaptodrosophila lebanonensis]
MAKWADVIVIGSANVDYITYVPNLPRPGETVAGTHFETCFGGKGANQCLAAAKLGAKTALVAKVGQDATGDDYLTYLDKNGIIVEHVEQIKDQPTGLAQIAVSDDGENNIIIVAGANACMDGKAITRAKKLIQNSKVLLCQLETNVNATLCALRLFKGISIVNAAPVLKEMPPEIFSSPSIFCVNEVEAAQLTDRDEIKTLQDARAAAIDLIDKGANSVIITLGAQGAVYMSKDNKERCLHVPAEPVDHVVDTSGAGDAFIGALAYHLARFPNLPRERHIYAANSVAAHSIQHRGTQPSFPGEEKAHNNLCMERPEFFEVPETAEEPPPNANEGEEKGAAAAPVVEAAAAATAADPAPAAPPEAEVKSEEVKPAETQPESEAKPAETKPESEAKPADPPKPTTPRQSVTKPVEQNKSNTTPRNSIRNSTASAGKQKGSRNSAPTTEKNKKNSTPRASRSR